MEERGVDVIRIPANKSLELEIEDTTGQAERQAPSALQADARELVEGKASCRQGRASPSN